MGSVAYSDPTIGLSLNDKKLSSFVINSNHAQLTGTGTIGKKKKVSFTVDVFDFGDPGNNDIFSISLSNGYSASGHLTSGNILLH